MTPGGGGSARAAPLAALLLAGALALPAHAGPSPASSAQPADSVTLALVGGQVIDGYGESPIEDGVVLISGDRIARVGSEAEVEVPEGTRIVSTEGMTVMPGLFDMHVHLQILGHGDYERWNELYGDRLAEDVMPVAARQLLAAGVTSARDLGAPPEDILEVRRRIRSGEVPGPRLFVAGAFLQDAPYEPWQSDYRWGVDGPDDARSKVQRLVEAGVDVIKLIDQDRMEEPEVEAVVDAAHEAGLPVVAHAHRVEEILVGLEHGVDNFEHTGLGTAPGYPERVMRELRERNLDLHWTPTVSPLYVMRYTGSRFPERLDDPGWRRFMPDSMAREIRASLEHIPRLPYYADFPARIPTLPDKFGQLREAGVKMMIGTDAGIPSMFHIDATWREMERWQRLGVDPMRIIQAATLVPARFLGVQDRLGTLAPGKLADVIAVRGDPLRDMRAMRDVEVVVKDGQRIH